MTFCIAFHIFVLGGVRDFKFGRKVDRSKLVPARGWQTIPERGVVRSHEPLKFWWAWTWYGRSYMAYRRAPIANALEWPWRSLVLFCSKRF